MPKVVFGKRVAAVEKRAVLTQRRGILESALRSRLDELTAQRARLEQKRDELTYLRVGANGDGVELDA